MMSSFIDHVVLEQREDIDTKMVQLREQWHRFESYLAKRIELGEKYAGFHSLAVKVAHQVSMNVPAPGQNRTVYACANSNSLSMRDNKTIYGLVSDFAV